MAGTALPRDSRNSSHSSNTERNSIIASYSYLAKLFEPDELLAKVARLPGAARAPADGMAR
jgi:hypothetical protein